METKANYVLIGAVTLAGIVGSLMFFLWFAHLSLDRRYDYYDILFDQVSGLSNAADVQFNGITVGRVTDISIHPDDAARVRVRVEVDADTPIRSDTVATLQAQGVTGVSFVSLSGNEADAPPLEPDPKTGVPIIPSRPSTLNTLLETAPELLREARDLLKGLSAFTGEENQQRVTTILDNLATASGGLEKAIADISNVSGSVREGVGQIADFTGKLDGISQQLTATLATAETTLASATTAFDEAKGTLTTGTAALDAARLTFQQAGSLIQTRAPELLDRYEAVADSVRLTSDELRGQMTDLSVRLDAATDLAADRLRDLQAPIAAAGPAIASIGTAADGMDALLRGDGAALAAEARRTLAATNRILETDAPAIIADLRAAAATVNRVVDEVGAQASGFAGRLDGLSTKAETALDGASATFRTANARLEQLEPAIGTAEQALTSANAAFGSADRMLNTDVEPVVADLRATIARFDAALQGVATELPGITTDVRDAAASASRAAGRMETLVAGSAGPIEGFSQQGLPQFTRLAAEARQLVGTLEQLTRRIERDPARFFLGGQAPEYRR